MAIATEGIIDQEYAELLKSFIAGDRWVDYYIERRNTGINIPIEKGDSDVIDNSMRYIDSITGLRIRETSDRNNADIYFTQVDRQFFDNPIDEGTLGYTEAVTNGLRNYFDVVYVDDEVNDFETLLDEAIIRHETGHALGLEHPYGDGYNPNFTMSDTIMSYNPKAGNPMGFKDSDYAALKQLWGEAGTNYDYTGPATIPTKPTTPAVSDSALVANLVSNTWLTPREVSLDTHVTYHIDINGKYKFNKVIRGKGKSGGVSRSEAAFIRDVFAQVDSAISASIAEVGTATQADIVIGSITGNRRLTSRNAYTKRVEAGWGDEKITKLTESEKSYIGYAIASSFGLSITSSNYTTNDSVMGYKNNGYHGITVNDIAALQQVWNTQLPTPL